jgi:cellulose synthase/poly-beta-1,6-N-acetylglucosamine synthase-like glycosyltransferase
MARFDSEFSGVIWVDSQYRNHSNPLPSNNLRFWFLESHPFISVIIPCRNEEKYIKNCLESIIKNDYPKDKLEIIVIDGMSEDNTTNLAKEYSLKYNYIYIIENIDKTTPCALNKGIKQARGDVIVRMDAHSEYPKDFLLNGIKYLNLTKADVVGGPIITKPASERLVARAISEVTSHKFGVGNSSFRTGKMDGYVDTVPFGFFRKTIFDKVGLFDERLIRNQDNEMNSRIIESGGKIYLTSECTATYYNQAKLSGLLRQALRTGMWNVRTLQVNPNAFRWRHFIPFLFITSLFITLFLSLRFLLFKYIFVIISLFYLFLAIMFSLEILYKKRDKVALLLPPIFILYHCSYGIGTFYGAIQVFMEKLWIIITRRKLTIYL